MRCLNCNLTVKDGTEYCPACKAKISNEYHRCPKCFFKFEISQNICPKCKHDLTSTDDVVFEFYKETQKTNSTVTKRVKDIFKKHKAVFLSVFAVILLGILTTTICVHHINEKNIYTQTIKSYCDTIDEGMEDLDFLAEAYNDVYDGEWLNQVSNINKLEKKHAETISKCKSDRDSLNYSYNKLKKYCDDKTLKILNENFSDYEKCYLYVIEKYGKYPGYLQGYKPLSKQYQKSIKKLNDILS